MTPNAASPGRAGLDPYDSRHIVFGTVITGDPRVCGRVHLATNGRDGEPV
ncbi:hypothetical protein K4B79_04125 [Streptomyces lincolnensis]|nr:hypothetical protein [Streptomyces lincolnensis]MCD7437407.1 hypothetical protein [Streptomyces lincolnensis]